MFSKPTSLALPAPHFHTPRIPLGITSTGQDKQNVLSTGHRSKCRSTWTRRSPGPNPRTPPVSRLAPRHPQFLTPLPETSGKQVGTRPSPEQIRAKEVAVLGKTVVLIDIGRRLGHGAWYRPPAARTARTCLGSENQPPPPGQAAL